VFAIDLELRTLPHGPVTGSSVCTSLSRGALSFSQGLPYVHAPAPREPFVQPLMQPESTRGAAAKPSPDVGAIARQRCVTNLTNRRIGSINAVGDMSIDWIVLEKTIVQYHPGASKSPAPGRSERRRNQRVLPLCAMAHDRTAPRKKRGGGGGGWLAVGTGAQGLGGARCG
jgi:hypothetical protein